VSAIRGAWACGALLLAVLAGCSGCMRKPQYQPLQADSTATVPVDSLALLVRNAQELWEADGEGEAAARSRATAAC